jgi:hypothetical protein
MGHSDRIVLNLLHKHLGPDFALSVTLPALSRIVCTLLCQQSVHLFQAGLLCLISLQY